MSSRNGAICAILVTVLVNSGCVTPCYKCYKSAWEHGPEYDLPTPCRNRVHVFLMHGLTPSTDSGLNALRLKLGESGFAKVGTGELCHAGWVKDEIACIRQHDPDARFVLLGYDLGAAVVTSLARDLAAKGVSVEAVVLLDPMGCSAEPCGARTILITSGNGTARVPHSERIVVPDASHFGLPTHPTTVGTLTELLKDVAMKDCQTPLELVPAWSYPHAPAVVPISRAKVSPDWNFLADRPGASPSISTQVAARPPAPPASPAATAPVALKR